MLARSNHRANSPTRLRPLRDLGAALCFTAEEISGFAGVPVDVAAAVLAALATPFGQTEPDLFKAAERIRARPYLDLGDGSYFPTVPGNDLWALRAVLEAALTG